MSSADKFDAFAGEVARACARFAPAVIDEAAELMVRRTRRPNIGEVVADLERADRDYVRPSDHAMTADDESYYSLVVHWLRASVTLLGQQWREFGFAPGGVSVDDLTSVALSAPRTVMQRVVDDADMADRMIARGDREPRFGALRDLYRALSPHLDLPEVRARLERLRGKIQSANA